MSIGGGRDLDPVTGVYGVSPGGQQGRQREGGAHPRRLRRQVFAPRGRGPGPGPSPQPPEDDGAVRGRRLDLRM